MFIIKRFVQKIKQLVQVCKNYRSDRQIVKEYYESLGPKWPCQDCGKLGSKCTCTSENKEPEVPQMGLPAGENEEEIPLWLEHANEKCSSCGRLPEFCQCQYEE